MRRQDGLTGSRTAMLAGVALGLLGMAGCRVDRSSNGEHVSMRTPVGGVEVRTDQKALQTSIGLPVFPGATPEQERDGKKKNAADVDLSFGTLRLRVKALSYRSDAEPAEVQAYYARELSRFGVVITCKDHRTIGTPERTPEGLTCDQRASGMMGLQTDVDPDRGHSVELKAGSPQHQRVVAVEPSSRGSTFALVLLDLPRGLGTGEAEEDH